MEHRKPFDIKTTNPVLLLSTKYLAQHLGFTSFDEFLKQSHYYRINISTNKIVENHTAAGTISMANPGDDYDRVLMETAKNYIYEEDRSYYVSNFDGKNMLNSWKEGKDFLEAEMRFVFEGRPLWIHVIYEVFKDDKTGEFFADILVVNIDSFKQKTEKVQKEAKKDILTGLSNRSAIEDIENKLAAKDMKHGTLIAFDIDNFKQVNDKYGHSFGDKAIKKCANKINEFFGKDGIVCRIGGDEFVALLPDMTFKKTEKLLEAFVKDPVIIENEKNFINITVSVGYSIFPKHGAEFKRLYKKADMAMYSVKMNGKGNFKVFNDDLLTKRRDTLGFNIEELSKGMPGGFLIYKAEGEGEIIFANDELIAMVGCKDFEDFIDFTYGTFNGFVHPKDVKWVNKEIENQLKMNSKKRDYVRYRIKTKDCGEKMVDDYGHLVDSKYNGKLFFVFILDLDYRTELQLFSNK